MTHRGARLGPEVLHDHFLDVPVLPVRLGDRFQGRHPVGLGLADADQYPGSKWDRQLTCGVQGG